MGKKGTVGITGYLPLMAMTAIFFTAASLVFIFVLGISDPVPVFIFFAFVQLSNMLLFALLPLKRKAIARKISMILIGVTIVVLAGLLGRQNFQLEGFIFLILGGLFGGPIIHYMMKLGGTFFSGRTWCSWACWTSMLFDFLPYKNDTSWKGKSLPRIRYVHFALSIAAVVALYFLVGYTPEAGNTAQTKPGTGNIQVAYWFAAGNVLYYIAGIALAFKCKDNRAFCKYLCPVAVPLKFSGIFSLVRIKARNAQCSGCKKCESVCPASIKVHSYTEKGQRVASTECMMCLNCVAACPEGNLKTSFGADVVKRENLNRM